MHFPWLNTCCQWLLPPALAQLLGDTRADAKRKLEERLQRRQELTKEREAKGLSTEEAMLDAIQDEEEEENKKKRRRVSEAGHVISMS